MQISETIGTEAVFFLVSVCCGMGLVWVYDLFRIVRRLMPHGNIWIGIEDICYWIFCTIAVFLLLYERNNGMVRAFCFIGIALGGALYMSLLSRFWIKICVKVLGTVLKLFRKIWEIAGAPFVKSGKKTLIFLRKRLKKLYKAIKMGLCKL